MTRAGLPLVVLALVPFLSLVAAPGRAGAGGPVLTTGVHAGYMNGPGMQVTETVSDVAQGFPLKLRLGLAYSRTEPGNAAEARQIFINDATDGTPRESGHTWDYRLDVVSPIHLGALPAASLLTGIRYSRFNGHFEYVGGNEEFDVTSNSFGLGTGLQSLHEITPGLDLVWSTGIDYYFASDLAGHDTTYDPDGEHINPRDFEYSDADEAINQPTLELRFLAGLSFK